MSENNNELLSSGISGGSTPQLDSLKSNAQDIKKLVTDSDSELYKYIVDINNFWESTEMQSFEPTEPIQQYAASNLYFKSFVMAVQFNTTEPVYGNRNGQDRYFTSDDLTRLLQRIKINVRDIDGNSFEAAIGPWAYVNRGSSGASDVEQYTLMCTGDLRGCFTSQNFFTTDDNYQLKPINSMWGGWAANAGNDITKRKQLRKPIGTIDVIRQVVDNGDVYNIQIPANTYSSYFRIVIYGVPVTTLPKKET